MRGVRRGGRMRMGFEKTAGFRERDCGCDCERDGIVV